MKKPLPHPTLSPFPAAVGNWRWRLFVLLTTVVLLNAAGRAGAQTPGSPDLGFNATTDNFISTLAIQPDGKLVIAGGFTQVNGTARKYLARLNADGTLDTAFSASVNNYGVFTLAVQSDGKIVIGGSFTQIAGATRTSLARLNADGSVDASYRASADRSVYAAAVQPDGKTVIGGYFTSVNGVAHSGVARLNADGSLDASFNPSANNFVNAVAVQPDGKILIGGDFTQVNGATHNGIARLNADGSLDGRFIASADGSVETLTLQPDGKIILGGLFSQVGGTARANVARLNTNGSLDTGFNANTDGEVNSVVLQMDGKILVGGAFNMVDGTARTKAARLNSDGTLDGGFNVSISGDVLTAAVQSDGKIVLVGSFFQVNGVARNYVVRLVGGASTPAPVITSATSASAQVNQVFSYQISASNNPTSFTATGLPPGLSLNTSTGLLSGTPTQTGTFSVLLSATNATGTGTAVLSLTVSAAPVPPPVINSAGSASGQVGLSFSFQLSATNNPTRFAATGLPPGLVLNISNGLVSGLPTQAGTYNVSFSATNAGGTDTRGFTLTILPAAPAITSAASAAGQAGQPFSFQVAASNAPTSFSAVGLPAALSINPTTGLITGTPGQAGVFTVILSATNAGGAGTATLTLTFATALLPPAITSATSVNGVAGQPFAYQITATNAPSSFGAIPLPAGLSLDTASGLISGIPAQAGIYPVSLGATNAGGTGVLAAVFNVTAVPAPPAPAPGGVSLTFNPGTGADGQVRAVAFLPDGRAFIAGAFSSFRDAPRSGIARVNADGTLDTSFNPGSGTDQPVNALLVQADGKVVLGGDFTSINGVPRNGVARLNADGSVDATFDAGLVGTSAASAAAALHYPSAMPRRMIPRAAARSGFVTSLSSGPNGTIVLGGAFQQVANAAVQAVARLTANGAVDPTFSTTASAPNGPVRATVTQPDGKTVIGGEFSAVGNVPRNGVARLNTDGSLDGSFDPGAGALGGPVDAVVLQPEDGAVVLGGDFTAVDNQPRGRIARVRSDGHVDTSFNPGSGANATVRAIVLQLDGKLLLGGAFTQIADTVRNAVARLNADGSPDKSFDPGSGANAPVNAIALRPSDGSALLGGDFTQVGTTPLGRVALIGAGDAPAPTGAVVVSVVGAGPTRGGFVLSRTGSTARPVTVLFHNGGSAVRDQDYVAFPGSVTIPSGQSESVIAVTLLPGANRNHKVKVFLDADPNGGSSYQIAKAQSKVFLSDLP